ncbi:MAG: hypothetical protein J7J86_10095 [Bacteroidales bacterium]|nr:hypothetical protein [Bacteroidales bacterium]
MKPVYIILAILWILYGFYKKSIKNKAAQEKDSSEPQNLKKAQNKNFINEIFGDFLSDNESPNPYESMDMQENTEIIEENIQKEELKKQAELLKVKKEIQKTTVSFEEDTDDDNIDFDLKNAVIYSEILKRPDY